MKEQRFWEIDSARGVAIAMMVVFHIVFDLYYFWGYDVDISSVFWFMFARLTASIFIFLVGMSLTISYARASKKSGGHGLFAKYLKRGLKIMSLGMILTLATWMLLERGAIIFGVLHFIGLSIILAYPFLRFKLWKLLMPLSVIIIIAGLFLSFFTFDFPWLLWLGLRPEGFYTLDYFPVLPCFGALLLGMYFGNLLYPKGERKFKLANLSRLPLVKVLSFLGRHSLLIYFLHQPIILAIIYILIR
jgi:uncharacterized membrane protein